MKSSNKFIYKLFISNFLEILKHLLQDFKKIDRTVALYLKIIIEWCSLVLYYGKVLSFYLSSSPYKVTAKETKVKREVVKEDKNNGR